MGRCFPSNKIQVSMAIHYYSESEVVPPFLRREVGAWITSVAESYGMTIGELNYQFCNNEQMLEMNSKFLDHHYYTDIITFPSGDDDEVLVADILISLDQVRLNAADLGVAPGSELLRVMIHGVLHLCGQDDVTPELEAEMHRAEDQALAQLPERVWRAVPAAQPWVEG